MNVNKVENNKLYMKYYNSKKKGLPDYNNNPEYKAEYLKLNKQLIDNYKNNNEYWFHQKTRGRPPNWKKDIDKERNKFSRNDGKYLISFC